MSFRKDEVWENRYIAFSSIATALNIGVSLVGILAFVFISPLLLKNQWWFCGIGYYIVAGGIPFSVLGFILSLVTYALMFINFPMNATLGETSDIGYIDPSKEIALTTSFILGFSDACFNTQVN